jgi:multidrug efflux pump subunit AcrA (membrane-fusion protein)
MSVPRPSRRRFPWLLPLGLIVVAICCAWFTRDRWRPMFAAPASDARAKADASNADEHESHNHGAAKADAIEVSSTGLKNIGFQAATIELRPFERSEVIPAIVVERPGKTQVHVTAPFTGVVSEIYLVEGQAVEAGEKLFALRLTHEELVAVQQEFLKTIESLDVVDREVDRLRSLGNGVVPGKRIIDLEYEKQKFQASLRAAEQALLLHGLSEEQVADISKTRQLLRSVIVTAPNHNTAGEDCPTDHSFHVQRLPASPGQQIEAGQELCVLADHCELYIEGRAFEDDAELLRRAARENWNVTARLLAGTAESSAVTGLKLLYLSDSVDPESRALHFYVPLPNSVVRDQRTPEGRRFIEWRFKPGQRVEVSIPVERWEKKIVLPAEAVVEQGAERFVYRQNGKLFERVPIHVEYSDGKQAVVSSGDGLFPGDVIAGRGAYQIHLQLKNKSGGAVDPHAGHNH